MLQTNKELIKILFAGLLCLSITACGRLNRLSEIGEGPQLSKIENPVEQQNYKPITMPMPTPVSQNQNANSLWRTGARGFFKDQRASKIGDIVTIQVAINDKAELDNKSEQKRDNDSDTVSINALAGIESNFNKVLPEAVNPSNLIDLNTSREIIGEGKIDREEEIELTMAAIVTQILPNGNLVIQGSQEIRVNFELRQLTVSGIIRRADIKSDNTIDSSKIAELRMAYGGKGTMSDVQKPRYGREVLDIIMPF